MTNLEPCPFCNAEDDLGPAIVDTGHAYFIECQDCGSCGSSARTEEEAAEAWNTRASPPILHDEPVLDVNGNVIYTLRTVRV